MIDAAILPLQRSLLASPARWLARRGVTADGISLVGFGLGVLAVPALAAGLPGIALVLILANRLADGLDGAVARLTRPTDRGAFLDIGFDFLFYAAVPLGFALMDPARNALAAAVLIAAFVGTGSSFLAFATVAGQRGERAARSPTKGITYLGGLTEGAETIALFIALCLWPSLFPPLALAFAAACALTTAARLREGWIAFGPPPRRASPGDRPS